MSSTSTSRSKKHRIPAAVKRLLRPRGRKAELARRAGVSLSMVCHWVDGREKSANLMTVASLMVAEQHALAVVAERKCS